MGKKVGGEKSWWGKKLVGIKVGRENVGGENRWKRKSDREKSWLEKKSGGEKFCVEKC